MSDPISDEHIAELLDGKLSAEERAELLTRLSASREDFAVFAETGGVLREAEEADAGPEVGPGPPAEAVRDDVPAREAPAVHPAPPSVRQPSRWGRRPSRWLALAAVLALAVLSPLLWSRFRGGPGGVGAPVALLASRDAGLPPGWLDTPRPWGVTRGGGDPMEERGRARGARVGALHTDLALAIAGGDTVSGRRLAGAIVALLENESWGTFPAISYRTLHNRVGEPRDVLEPLLAEAGESAAGSAPEGMVELGAWTEAARIAAARQDAEFFRSSAARRVLGRAAKDSQLSGEAREAARRLRETEPTDWPALAAHADALMRAIAG